jgi:UDP-N-acetylglucosamine--N-acetylmuramyl-(pentapeptide) pyrophosphoryl-undecaprenol N-acetylglucosamine transferase
MEAAKSRFEARSKHVVVNGNPLRASFFKPPARQEAAQTFGLSPDLKTLLVTGGSQGAKALNDSVLGALPKLLADPGNIQILHQVGDKNIESFRAQIPPSLLEHPRYCLRAYINDLSVAYALTDLTLCRAGAMTIAELTVMNIPAVFVPYPYAAQDHQMHNGRFMEAAGCAVVIPQSELNAEKLGQTVIALLQDQSRLLAMKTAMQASAKPMAAQDIARQLKEIGRDRAVDAPI